jgi:hypothetical protein
MRKIQERDRGRVEIQKQSKEQEAIKPKNGSMSLNSNSGRPSQADKKQ